MNALFRMAQCASSPIHFVQEKYTASVLAEYRERLQACVSDEPTSTMPSSHSTVQSVEQGHSSFVHSPTATQ